MTLALEEKDHAPREAMYHDLLESVEHENLMDNIFFSYEAQQQDTSVEQPRATFEWERNIHKVNVWLGV